MRTRILLTSLLALVGALGCTKGGDNPQPKSGPTSIQRAANPGIIPIDGSLKKDAFNNLSTVYLLAAVNGSPFSTQYDRLNELTQQGMSSDLQPAFEALVKHVRTGGDASADIQQYIDVLKKHPLGTTLVRVPGSMPYRARDTRFEKYAYPVFNFIYEVDNRDPAGPKLSLQALFRERNVDPSSLSKEVPVPLSALVGFQEPPQNIVLEPDHYMGDKDVIVPSTLTLPGACTEQGQDTAYKLTGVFRQPGRYDTKGASLSHPPLHSWSGSGGDKLEGLTYFRWGNQWYKITSSAPKPATTTEQEAQEVAEKSGYESSAFSYLYTRDDAA